VDEQAMRYEEQMLETKYPDFKSLMREYEEGILLFEATKQVVWDRAAKDTLGLEAFHEKNQKKYRWGERAETSIYRISKDLRGKMDEIRAFISTHSPEEVLAKYNTADEEMLVRHEAKRLEKKIYPAFKQMEWKTGALSQSEEDPQSGIFTVVKIERLIPPTEKTLDEARGYVVADYQDYLELDWVESLRKEYEVKVNEKVLKSLIRSKE
jgi:peptidyl-prolyl cis-trans isomerase SurA